MPTLADETPPMHLNNPLTQEASFLVRVGRAQRATQRLNEHITRSSGPVCIVVIGLDGFGTCADRTLRWATELGRNINFIYLVRKTQGLRNGGANLLYGSISSGYCLILFSLNESAAGDSPNIQILKKI